MFDSRKHSAKRMLMNTFEELLHKKSFQKISVHELCESAQVSRSAFYANFNDKYHLLSCCLQEKTEYLNALAEQLTPEEFLNSFLQHIQAENRFFYNTFASSLDEETLDILYQFFMKFMTSLLKQKLSQDVILPGPIEMVSAFYIGGLTSTTLSWIKSNYALPQTEVAACQYNLLKSIL